MARPRLVVAVVFWRLLGLPPDAFVARSRAGERIDAPSRHERVLWAGRLGEDVLRAAAGVERSRGLTWHSFPLNRPASPRGWLAGDARVRCPALVDRARRLFLAAGPSSPRAPPGTPLA